MLERIREGSQGTWATVILGLVILSFAFAGIGSYVNSSINSAAATVNGQDISNVELEKAYQNEKARMESQYGEAFAALSGDAGYLLEFKKGVLNRLISEELIDQAAQELGLRVSDAQIKQAIVSMQEFQIDGKFDNDRYLVVLRGAGLQANQFRDIMRRDMVRNQLSQALLGTEFALPGEAQQFYQLQAQTRDAKYFTVSAAAFADGVEVTDEQINSYYQANISSFDTEQKVSVAYVELSLEDLLPAITVTDEELEQEYQASLADYKQDEERRASHILIEFGEDEAASEQLANEVLAKVNGGEDFAALAQQYSTDAYSAEQGGDVDWFGKGIMDPAFEEAAFALANVGDVSAVVKSEFGFHIIKLTDIKPEQLTPFAEVKTELAQKIKTHKAEEQLYSLQQKMAEVAFEMPDHLEEVAAVANKPIVTSELFSRSTAPANLASAKVLNAAFDPELIEQGLNSEVLELADNQLMVLRVVNSEPERTKDLAEVSDEIKQRLTDEGAREAAKAWAQDILSKLNEQQDVSAELQAKAVEWQEKQGLSRIDATLGQQVMSELFKLSEDPQHNSAVVETLSGDVTLVQLVNINAAQAAENNVLDNVQRRLAGTKQQQVYSELLESLKAQADIEIHI